jgi:hypothetical protein
VTPLALGLVDQLARWSEAGRPGLDPALQTSGSSLCRLDTGNVPPLGGHTGSFYDDIQIKRRPEATKPSLWNLYSRSSVTHMCELGRI